MPSQKIRTPNGRTDGRIDSNVDECAQDEVGRDQAEVGRDQGVSGLVEEGVLKLALKYLPVEAAGHILHPDPQPPTSTSTLTTGQAH